MNRRGFTLSELLVGLSVMAILGVALTRILINDSRFVSRQDAMLGARQGARAALSTIVAELSVVADTPIVATRDSLEVRVPVAFGLTCRAVGSGIRIVSILPVDSVAWASFDTTGLMWRRQTGGYRRLNPGWISTTTLASDSAQCKADSVRMIAGGKLIRVGGLDGTSCDVTLTDPNCQPDSLAVAMLYSRVKYLFAPSSDLPGRIGLWRRNQKGVVDELVTPFDTGASFAYLMGGPNAATMTLRTTDVTSTASRDSIRGVELRLYAASENKTQGASSYQVFPLKTRIRFSNR